MRLLIIASIKVPSIESVELIRWEVSNCDYLIVWTFTIRDASILGVVACVTRALA